MHLWRDIIHHFYNSFHQCGDFFFFFQKRITKPQTHLFWHGASRSCFFSPLFSSSSFATGRSRNPLKHNNFFFVFFKGTNLNVFCRKTSFIEDESRALETKVGRPILVCLPSLALVLLLPSQRTARMLSINRRERPRFRSFVRSRPLTVATATERVRRQTKKQRPFSCGSHTVFLLSFLVKKRQGERRRALGTGGRCTTATWSGTCKIAKRAKRERNKQRTKWVVGWLNRNGRIKISLMPRECERDDRSEKRDDIDKKDAEFFDDGLAERKTPARLKLVAGSLPEPSTHQSLTCLPACLFLHDWFS